MFESGVSTDPSVR